MPLQGHWERVNTPLRSTTGREGRLLIVIAAMLLVSVAVGAYAAVHDGSSKAQPGCIEVTAAHTMGGATLKACGPAAARWCRSVQARDDAVARAVRARCRTAGYR